ncbi:serine/threonine-protein kinase [Hyalangium gracile]|uniref:serine/threonine-protein kinase n=1 Tax=Hyalangium gracile TaxID=394092 RepID=UPI001CC93B51|nr:serine/threonine-protein kinase [Hyalangium gracile]
MTDELTPDSLRLGSLVGPWRVEGYAGRGTYGVVYKARRAGHPGSAPVALKLALFAFDPRFLREVELLSRTRHPSVPDLLDRGWWHSSEGRTHPYLVMEWIHGVPLYEWGRVHRPTSRQVLQVVAQVAWGLEVLHRAGGLHRDVKGDNILVEPEGQAFLADFGSGTWEGAAPLTDNLMPPGTREYRSPEALRFQWNHLRQHGAHYEARTHDDLYALGVSAYRLVTGMYPPPGTDPEARLDPSRSPFPPREPPRVLNERVIPELSALIERMMAAEPVVRGLAREVAEAAETAAEHAGREADVPLAGQAAAHAGAVAIAARVRARSDAPVTTPVSPPAEVVRVPTPVLVEPEVHGWRDRARIVLVAGCLALVTGGIWWTGHGAHTRRATFVQVEELAEGVEGYDEPASLADASVTTRVSPLDSTVASGMIALQVPDDPLPGQMRAPCRRRGTVEINGGCWIRWADYPPPCGDKAYEWKGECFMPVYGPGRPPTSKKPQ